MQLGIEISENTKARRFLNYSGHVDLLNVMIFYSGWSDGRSADYKKDIYLNTESYRTEEDIIDVLEGIYAELAKYKEELK